MNHIKRNIRWIFFLLIALLIFNSCTLERKLALEFIENNGKGTPVMIVPPELLYMFNNKAIMTNQNEDSVRFYSSQFLQYLSDSVFLENYFNAFIEKSYSHGLTVFLPDQVNNFIEQNRASYIINFAQMDLTEDFGKFDVETQINFMKTTKSIPVQKISLSTWFEISMKDSASSYTYFDEQYITDEIFGEFQQEAWSLDITYNYTKLDIDLEDIYDFAKVLGEKHASYFFDLVLNSYIWDKLPQEKRDRYIYLHYNSEYRSIESAEEAFIMLDQ